MMLVAFMAGASVGSFLNALLYRIDKGTSVLRGRSHCPSCSHQLAWSDLVPILSFLILRGRCRYCGGRIHIRYLAVELAMGVLFLLPVLLPGFSLPETLLLWGILFLLAFIFLYDAAHYLILDKSLVALAILSLFLRSFFWGDFVPAFFSAFLASGFFLSIFLVSRGRWMGFGDVKLVFVLGFLLSWPATLSALFVAVSSGAVIGLVQIALQRKKMGSEIPFGPFLVSGAAVGLFWGQALFDWYLSLVI